MEWLKDKKNQPFVIAGALVLILGSIAFMLFQNGVFTPSNPTPVPVAETTLTQVQSSQRGPGPPTESGSTTNNVAGNSARMGNPLRNNMPDHPQTASSAPAGMPSGPPTMPTNRAMPMSNPGGAAGATASATATGAPAVIQPINPATAKDPFSVALSPKAALAAKSGVKTVQRLPSLLSILPPDNIYTGVSVGSQLPPAPPVTEAADNMGGNAMGTANTVPLPRLSGIMYDNGVYALIQPANGPTETVKAGDTIPDVGKVVSIQADSITVKESSGQTVDIQQSTAPPPMSGGYPGQNMGGYPGQPYNTGRPYNPGQPYNTGQPYGQGNYPPPMGNP